MGYTHYFQQNKHATSEQWAAICDSFRKLQAAALLSQAFPIQREEDNSGPVEITDTEIIFNGIGSNGHETMVLERDGNGFNFCKTARKPYDRAVVALLILANHFAPGVWDISSDGQVDNWLPTLEWMNSLGMAVFELPHRVVGG